MIPLSTIIANVRTRYEAESTVRWSDADITDAINEGLDDLSEVTHFYERHVAVPIIGKKNYYDLRGWLPENALGVTSIWSSVRETWLIPATVNQWRSQWERSSGPAEQFAMRGFFWMAIWPRPESGDGYFRVYFPGLAPHYTHAQSVLLDLLDDFEPALEDYALYELNAQDGEGELAVKHFKNYEDRAKKLADFVERRLQTARVIKMGSRVVKMGTRSSR